MLQLAFRLEIYHLTIVLKQFMHDNVVFIAITYL